MDARQTGIMIMVLGVAVIFLGWLVTSGLLNWFGRLPGDIRIVSDSTRVYIPLTSMLLVSLLLTVVLNLIRRL